MPNLTLADLASFDPNPMRGGNRERYLCPFCGTDKGTDNAHRCLSYSPLESVYICFRCGAKGKVGDSSDLVPRPPHEARRIRQEIKEQEWAAISAARGMANSCLPIKDTKAERYLVEERGLTKNRWNKLHDIRFSIDWFGRPAVVFVSRNEQGYVRAAQGRYFDKDLQIRMRTTGKSGLGVFATFSIKQRFQRRIAVCEAPLDALSFAELNHCGAIATLGCAHPRWFLPHAERQGLKEIIVATDNDEAGDKEASKWIEMARECGIKPTRARPKGKDWNDDLRSKKGLL